MRKKLNGKICVIKKWYYDLIIISSSYIIWLELFSCIKVMEVKGLFSEVFND